LDGARIHSNDSSFLSSGGALGLELQLLDDALGCRDVGAGTEIDRLVDAAALTMGVEVADLADVADLGDRVVRRNGDVASGDQRIAVVEAEGDAAFEVDSGDDKRRAFDELL